MRNELNRHAERRVLRLVPNNSELRTYNSELGEADDPELGAPRLFFQRCRLEIPLCNAVEADLFEQGGAHASERGILRIGLDEIAQAGYGVVPKPTHGIPSDALDVTTQIDFHFYETCTELTALDDAACHNILRR